MPRSKVCNPGEKTGRALKQQRMRKLKFTRRLSPKETSKDQSKARVQRCCTDRERRAKLLKRKKIVENSAKYAWQRPDLIANVSCGRLVLKIDKPLEVLCMA
mmetsp:Transcript_16319/g.42041  ORF Transcript_16319/g.42041 Transcript_16319/m.42041 type:complete len:102 (-) Transcript_16319:397-702(-)